MRKSGGVGILKVAVCMGADLKNLPAYSNLVHSGKVSGFGFRVSGFGFRVSGFEFRVSGFRF